jgi:hypothetical protein
MELYMSGSNLKIFLKSRDIFGFQGTVSKLISSDDILLLYYGGVHPIPINFCITWCTNNIYIKIKRRSRSRCWKLAFTTIPSRRKMHLCITICWIHLNQWQMEGFDVMTYVDMCSSGSRIYFDVRTLCSTSFWSWVHLDTPTMTCSI